MPRKPRVFSPHVAFHIIARGNNRAAVFRSDRDFERYLELLAFFKTQYRFEVFHYCLMTNHVHLLMRFADREAFQKVPQRLQLIYAKHVVIKYQHVGHAVDYRWSSHRHYALGEINPLVTPNPMYLDLDPDPGARRQRYRDLVTVRRPYEEAVEEKMFGRSRWAKVAP